MAASAAGSAADGAGVLQPALGTINSINSPTRYGGSRNNPLANLNGSRELSTLHPLPRATNQLQPASPPPPSPPQLLQAHESSEQRLPRKENRAHILSKRNEAAVAAAVARKQLLRSHNRKVGIDNRRNNNDNNDQAEDEHDEDCTYTISGIVEGGSPEEYAELATATTAPAQKLSNVILLTTARDLLRKLEQEQKAQPQEEEEDACHHLPQLVIPPASQNSDTMMRSPYSDNGHGPSRSSTSATVSASSSSASSEFSGEQQAPSCKGSPGASRMASIVLALQEWKRCRRQGYSHDDERGTDHTALQELMKDAPCGH